MTSADRKLRDRRWVERIRDGDHAAFEALFRAYAEKLCAFAEQYVGSPEGAEGLVQEVFLSVWRRRQSLRLQGSIKSYLYTAARHRALNHLKHQRVVERWAEHVASREDVAPQRAASPTPEEELRRKELSAVVWEAVEQLPERRRLVFTLSREHGLTYKEIAGALDISVSTVETQMRRAFKTLRRLLSGYVTSL